MKKSWILLSFIIITSLALFGGCTKKTPEVANPVAENETHSIEMPEDEDSSNLETEKVNTDEETENIFDPDKESLVFEEYKVTLIKDFSSKNALTFLRKNIKYLGIEKSDQAIFEFIKHLLDSQSHYINIISSDNIQKNINSAFNYDSSTFDSDLYDDKDTKDMIIDLIDSGYKLSPDEGIYYPIIDYGILKEFSPYLSEEIVSYINILATDSDNPINEDFSSKLDLEDLSNRILTAENHLLTYTDGQTFQKIYDVYKNYMSFYVVTMATTEGFDFDTEIIDDNLKNSYKDFINKSPNSISKDIILKYYNILKSNDFTLSQDAFDFIDNFDKILEENIFYSQSK